MMKNWENNGTEEIGLVTPTPGQVHLMYVIARCDDKHTEQQTSINTSSYHSEFSQTGPRLNIKTVLFTYGDFHVKDKTAVRTSYL